MQPGLLQFGPGPRSWMMLGIWVCMAGLVALLFGVGWLWTLAEHEALLSHWEATVFGAVCLVFGVLFTVDGLLLILQRKRLKIVISDQAVHIGRLCRTDDIIAFTDIRRVRRGLDCVVLEVENRRFPYPLDHFKSMEEQVSFVEELSKRITGTTAHA